MIALRWSHGLKFFFSSSSFIYCKQVTVAAAGKALAAIEDAEVITLLYLFLGILGSKVPLTFYMVICGLRLVHTINFQEQKLLKLTIFRPPR